MKLKVGAFVFVVGHVTELAAVAVSAFSNLQQFCGKLSIALNVFWHMNFFCHKVEPKVEKIDESKSVVFALFAVLI